VKDAENAEIQAAFFLMDRIAGRLGQAGEVKPSSEMEKVLSDYFPGGIPDGISGLVVLEAEVERRQREMAKTILLMNNGTLYRPLSEYGPVFAEVAAELRAEGKIPPEDLSKTHPTPKAER
jgi:hypothetical protein